MLKGVEHIALHFTRQCALRHIKTIFSISASLWAMKVSDLVKVETPAGFIVRIKYQIQKLDSTNYYVLPTNEITKTKFVEIK